MTQPNDDLLWTAYRYSAGELSETEAAEFELLMADDQGAREALATVVGLAETVRAIESTAPVMASVTPASISQPAWLRSTGLRSAGWVAIGAAACLALLFVRQGFQGQGFQGAGFGPQDAPPGVVAQVEPADDHSQLLAAMLDGTQADENAEEASPFVAGIVGDDRQELLGPELEPLFDVSGLDSGLNDGDREELDDPNTTPDWLIAAVVESKS